MLKVEISGAMLDLQLYYGHLLSGMPSYDCDNRSFTKTNATLVTNSNAISPTPNPYDKDLGESLDNDTFSLIDSPSCNSNAELTIVRNTFSSTPISASAGLSPKSSNTLLPNPFAKQPTSFAGTSSVVGFSPKSSTVSMANTVAGQSEIQNKQPPQFFATSSQRRRGTPKSSVDEMRRQLIDEERRRMAVFGELRMQLYQDESDARLDEIRQRKAMSAALHKKQIQFWNTAIQRISTTESEQLSVGTIIGKPGKKYVESEVCNLVKDYELASHSDTSMSIETESNLFDSFVYQEFPNDKETANSDN